MRRLAADGRDPERVPDSWRDMLDPREWRLNDEGLPARRAARVIVVRRLPPLQVLLVAGHDAADPSHSWLFTPGGGISSGESPRQAAVRELAEETGIAVGPDQLLGPVAHRSALFEFARVTARQDEEIFALLDPPGGEVSRAGWTAHEHEVLDSVAWWDLEELRVLRESGREVYPHALVELVRSLAAGWDGRCHTLQ